MLKKNTYTRAFEACEAFFTETGQLPTIEAIKPRIGVNSPSTISSAIKDWKTALANTIKSDKGALPGVPASLLDAVNGLWQLALDEARQVFNDKVEALQYQQTALAAQEAALLTETDRIQQLLQLSEQHYQEDVAQLKKEVERLAIETSRLTEQGEQYRDLATTVETENAVLNATLLQERDKLRRIEVQYDKEHEWSLMRIEQEKDSHRQQTQQEMQRCQSEMNRSKQELTVLQAKFEQLLKQQEYTRSQANALERSLSDEKLIQADLTLKLATLQHELNAKDDHIRELLAKKKKK